MGAVAAADERMRIEAVAAADERVRLRSSKSANRNVDRSIFIHAGKSIRLQSCQRFQHDVS
jgi:hypothetical protein